MSRIVASMAAIETLRATDSPSLRLVILPHLNGGPWHYKAWSDHLQADIEVLAACLPGHGQRAQEKPLSDWRSAVQDIVGGLQHLVADSTPYAIFGHSMGALLGFEVIRALAADGLPLPLHFFPSSHAPPTFPKMEVGEVGELPAAEPFLPTLQADLAMYASYCYDGQPFSFVGTRVTALGGLEDSAVPVDHLQQWASFTQGHFELKLFSGGHFYWKQEQECISFLNLRLHDSLRALPVSISSTCRDRRSIGSDVSCVTDLVFQQSGALTVEDAFEKISLEELRCRSLALAMALPEGPEAACVGLLLHRDISFITAMLAVWRAGGCIMVLEQHFPRGLVQEHCLQTQPRALLVASEFVEKVQGLCPLITCERGIFDSAVPLVHSHFLPSNLEAPAFLTFTSGTSGKPKMIQCSHRAVVVGHLSRKLIAYKDGEKEAANVMFSWEILRGVLHGQDVACIPDAVLTNPPKLFDFVESRGITRFLVTPSLLNLLLSAASMRMPTLRVLYSCGEVLPTRTVEACQSLLPHVTLVNSYSTWETGDVALAVHPPTLPGDQAVVGKLLQNVACAIVDANLQPVPLGVTGTLFVASEGLSSGYFNDPDLSRTRFLSSEAFPAAQAFPPDLQKGHQGLLWYNTGDRARFLNHAGPTLQILGRGDDTVKIRGHKLGLAFVEEAVNRLPGILSAVVAPVVNSMGQPVSLLCFFQAQGPVDVSGLRAQLQEVLPRWAVPAHFREMPFAPSESKKMPRRLMIAAEELGSDFESDSDLTDMEKKVAGAWHAVLGGGGQYNRYSNFYDYGGSLEFVSLSAAMKRLGLEVAVDALLANPTIAGMARQSAGVKAESAVFDSEREAQKFIFRQPALPILPEDVLAKARANTRKTVFLTGCSGFVGVYTLRALCLTPSVASVICLVRGTSVSAEERLRDACKAWFSRETSAAWLQKIRVLDGDISGEDLGLQAEDLQELKSKMDVAVHLAAEVNMLKPYNALAAANVGGTAKVLRLCASAQAPMLFTSTVRPFESEQPTGYRLSKEVAERLCWRARETYGIPSAVLQLGDIGMGSSPNSKLPESDYIIILLQACVALRCRPEARWAVSILHIEALVGRFSELLETLPLEDFNSVPKEIKGLKLLWEDLCAWLQPELRLDCCPLEQWKEMLSHAKDSQTPQLRRAQLLLPRIEAELGAEFEAQAGSAYKFSELSVDRAWASRLGCALRQKESKVLPILRMSGASAEEQTLAWVCPGPGKELEMATVALPPLLAHMVEIKVTHCGLCGSDLHLIDGEWGESSAFPQVCGHEIVGVVTKAGPLVKLQPGTRVGIGWQKGSCLECVHCLRGNEQFCKEAVCTCSEGERGGFCDRYRADARFCFVIPDGLSSAHAAPLLCAGHTVYTPLLHVGPGEAVGVLGIGGLGHLALQFAAKRGCRVTSISSNPAKQAESLQLGATHFICRPEDFDAAKGTLDFVLVCASHKQDWTSVLGLLAPQGALCFAGAVPPIEIDVFKMGFKGLRVLTSNTGGRKEMQGMLEFAARHAITPVVELMPMSHINTGIRRFRDGRVRYRIVFQTEDLFNAGNARL